MTRKDYILLAESLGKARMRVGTAYNEGSPYTDAEIQTLYEWAVADALGSDNPRFDRQHFLAIVRGERELQSRPPRKKAAVYHSGEQCGFTCDAHKA